MRIFEQTFLQNLVHCRIRSIFLHDDYSIDGNLAEPLLTRLSDDGLTYVIWSRVRRTWWSRICPVISSPLKSCSASSTKISSTSVTSHRLFLFHWWLIYCVVINKWVIIFLLNSQHSEKWNPNNQRKSQNEWR